MYGPTDRHTDRQTKFTDLEHSNVVSAVHQSIDELMKEEWNMA